MIHEKKNNYYNALAKKLPYPTTSSKSYWSILKTFYNTKKVPIIPPILIENKLETDFLQKANYFNKFFASKCTHLSNSSSLPSSLDLEAEARLTSINFTGNDIMSLCVHHKIISNGLPTYLYKLIPRKLQQYITKNVNDIATYQHTAGAFKFLFFP